MQVPLEITYRDVRRTVAIDSLIREKVAKLERVCDKITSCHVAIERPQSKMPKGNPFRVRLDIRIPHTREIIVKKEPGECSKDDTIQKMLRDIFTTAHRRIQNTLQRQRGEVKVH